MNNKIINFYRQKNFHKILSILSGFMVLLNSNLYFTLAREYRSNKTTVSTSKNNSPAKKSIAPILGGAGAVAVVSGILYYIFHDSDDDDAIMQQNSPTDESDLKDNSIENLALFKTYHMPFSDKYWPEILDREIDKSSGNKTADIEFQEN